MMNKLFLFAALVSLLFAVPLAFADASGGAQDGSSSLSIGPSADSGSSDMVTAS